MDLDQLVKQMAFEGKGFDEIQAELNALKSRFEDDEIRFAIRKIDTYIVQYQLASLEKSKGKDFMILGAIFFTLGISLTIYTFLIGNSKFVLMWGATIFGVIIFKQGKNIYDSPLEELVPRLSKFKKHKAFRR